jgi:lipopolysaccharide export system protein LptC
MKANVLFEPDNIRLWLLVLFAGLASLTSYWALEVVRSQDADDNQKIRTRPDYWVENFNFVKVLPNGQNDYRIVGAKLVHYPNDDHADITLPVAANLNPARLPMTIRSERGVINHIANQAKSEIRLYEKVVLDRPKTEQSNHVQLNTDYLLIYPDKHTMETNLPITILSGATITTGIGMKANDETQQMEILNDVHSMIPPRTQSLL